ncbi:MAG: serine protease Do [Halioglobus sp.]|jgi:serine protease Do
MRYLIAILVFSLAVPTVFASSLPDTIAAIRGGVVGVGLAYPPRQPNRKGDPVTFLATGFVVGDGLHVISNAHVVPKEIDTDNKQSLAVFSGRGANSRIHFARVVRTDDQHDLVLLKIVGPALPALTLGDSETVREGQEVAFTGFPIGVVLGLYPATHRGIISVITPIARPVETSRTLTAAQLKRMRDPFVTFQLDATAYPGNSGSPMFEPDTGRVIGVVNRVFIKETRESLLSKPSGISYAIPAVHVRNLLKGQ